MGSIQRYVTNRLGSTKVLEIPSFWLSYAVSTVEFIRIVAPKVAGSSPVGHSLICGQNVKNMEGRHSHWPFDTRDGEGVLNTS
jgi:hypothetical protein